MISSPACTYPVPMILNLPWPQSVNISMIAKRVSLSSSKTLHEGYRSRDVSAKQLHLLCGQMLQHCLIHLLEVRFLFFNSFRTVEGLTCNTRAVSRMPLAFRAISTICRLMSGDCP